MYQYDVLQNKAKMPLSYEAQDGRGQTILQGYSNQLMILIKTGNIYQWIRVEN